MTNQELKTKIESFVSQYKEIFIAYESLIQNELLKNKDSWAERYLIILTGQTKERFNFFINNLKKNIDIKNDILKQYDFFLKQLENVDKQNPHYLQLIFQELSNEGNLHQLQNEISQILGTLPRLRQDEMDFNAKQSAVHALNALFVNHDTEFRSILDRLIQLKAFEYFKDSDKNVVIIGANGSGKSSFARKTRMVLGENITIISAQKLFNFRKLQNVPLDDTFQNKLYDFQQRDKLGKNSNSINSLSDDLQNLIAYLVQQHTAIASSFFEESKNNVHIKRQETLLEKICDLWHIILVHRTLKYEKGDILVYPEDGNEYTFMQLSDGEKAVFYYIAHVLSAKQNSFIIVDEPENHLHLAIISKLWDTLEQVRSDCRFIYLTHNLDFAASRNNVEKLWMKKFEAPANWELQHLPTDAEIPETIYMELLGSRKRILFCEGTKDKLDNKLYSILFPDFTVIPVDGHINVINYTKAFNKSKNIHNNSAIGVIDGDFHSEDEKKAWEQEHIFSLDVQEVENLLCDELLINAAKEQFCASEDCIDKAKEELFKHIRQTLETQSIDYATQKVNYYFLHNLLEKAKSIDILETSYTDIVGKINVRDFYTEQKKLLNEIVEHKDFEMAIKKCNSKGMLASVYKHIEKDYINRLFKMLNMQKNLKKQILEKYFSKVLDYCGYV